MAMKLETEGGHLMSISLWLESLIMEEMFLLTYGIIFGLTVIFTVIGLWIDKKINEGK